MRPRMAWALAFALLGARSEARDTAFVDAGQNARAADDAELASALADLSEEDALRYQRAWETLIAAGPAAARAALEGWPALSAAERIARARLLERLAREIQAGAGLEAVLARLDPIPTPEAAARAALAKLLGSSALGAEAADAGADGRFARLAALAADDPAASVRQAAIEALGAARQPEAVPWLDGLFERLPPDERVGAARALASLPAARARIVRRVQAAIAGDDAAAAEPSTLAVLALGYGRALAELADGGAAPKERAPFLVLAQHPAPAVRTAARRALEGFLQRLVDRAEFARADGVLAALIAEGLDAREGLYRRARLAMAGSGDAAAARAHAERLVAATAGATDVSGRVLRQFGLVLAGAAAFAQSDLAAARADFEEARRVGGGLVAERDDLRPLLAARRDTFPVAPVGGALELDRLVDLGLIEVWLGLCAIAEGKPLESRDVLEPLARAHALVLLAQSVGERTDAVFDARSLDDFLERDLGPRRLLLESRELPGGAEGRYLDLQLALGRALASVAPEEVLGFERVQVPDPRLAGAFRDDERFGLLQEIAIDEWTAARRGLRASDQQLFARARQEDDPDRLSVGERTNQPAFRRFYGVEDRRRQAEERRAQADPAALRDPEQRSKWWAELEGARTPSLYALTLAGELREDGRSDESRALAERLLADLLAAPGLGGQWQDWTAARVELAIASAWMDGNRPLEAERVGLGAVKRLEGLEASLRNVLAESGDDPARAFSLRQSLRQTDVLRADALLSLAVNANVRQNDQPKALAFFERAYALDQRDFMRVLLACYRARSGHAEEARTVLRGVEPTPALYYNLACTHALLGEPDRALDWLARELEENHPTPGSLARQKEWSRSDPDLASLREDPRFLRLTGP